MDEKIIKLATDLHGHLAPGIALGLRMSELALSNLGISRGNKHLIAISETMDEKYFLIQNVEINRTQNFHSSDIVRCQSCSEPIPRGLAVIKENIVYCKACSGEAYYTLLEGSKSRTIGQ